MFNKLPVTVLTFAKRIRRDDRGATMVEYGLLLFFIAIAVVGVLAVLGPQIAALFQQVSDLLP
jgi:pilus assembly protein Flp/PilA